MKNQIEEAIEWICEDIDSTPKTPTKRKRFNEKEGVEELSDEKSDTFHTMLDKLLYIYIQESPTWHRGISSLPMYEGFEK